MQCRVGTPEHVSLGGSSVGLRSVLGCVARAVWAHSYLPCEFTLCRSPNDELIALPFSQPVTLLF